MTKKRHLLMQSIVRLAIAFLCIAIGAVMIPGISGQVYAAEVKGPRLLIVVQGEDGYRVPGLDISYLPPNAPQGAEPQALGSTDARGELVFTDLEEGEFQFFYILPNAKGKMRVPYTIKDVNGRPTLTISDPRLKGDKTAETVEDAAQTLDIVGFQVVDSQGSPVPNVKLAFWKCPSLSCEDFQESDHSRVFTTVTDREGNCAQSGMQTGSYHVAATVYDEYHQERFSETTQITIAIEDEKQTRTIPLSQARPGSKKPAGGVLSLYFENEGGNPQADIRVGYREPEGSADDWLGCTDAQGKISITDLKKGVYTFFYYVEADNNKTANREYFEYEVEDLAVSNEITVKVPIPDKKESGYCSPLEKWVQPLEEEPGSPAA